MKTNNRLREWREWKEKLKSIIESMSDERKDELLKMLQQDKRERTNLIKTQKENPELFWNKDKVLEKLKKDCVKVEENADMMWYKWRIVHINLPAIGSFKWFKFDYFVSDKKLLWDDIENDSKIEKKLQSTEKFEKLLSSLKDFMKGYWIKVDEGFEYDEMFNFSGHFYYECEGWKVLTDITWDFDRDNDDFYFLRNKDWETVSYNNFKECWWESDDVGWANLLLKIPNKK